MASAQELLAELGRVADAVGPAVAPPEAATQLTALTETARQLFGARACSLALLDAETSELVYTTAAGSTAEAVTGLRMPATHGIAGWVVQSGQQITLSDPREDPRFAREIAEQIGQVPAEIVAVPVRSAEEMLGVLTLIDRDAARPDARQDMTLLQLFADQAAIALLGARAFRQVGRLLLAALADATRTGEDLASELSRAAAAAARPERELVELAALFAELARQGGQERALAVRLLREVSDYSGRRWARPAV